MDLPSSQFSPRPARCARQPCFLYGQKTVRTKNTVMDKNKDGILFLYKIVDCARMGFHPCAIDDPRGRIFVRAKKNRQRSQKNPFSSF
jgi:hypothetical protein